MVLVPLDLKGDYMKGGRGDDMLMYAAAVVAHGGAIRTAWAAILHIYRAMHTWLKTGWYIYAHICMDCSGYIH